MELVFVEYFVSDSMDYLNLMTQKEVAEGVWPGIMRGVAKVQLTIKENDFMVETKSQVQALRMLLVSKDRPMLSIFCQSFIYVCNDFCLLLVTSIYVM